MTIVTMNASIVDNALDFIRRAAEDLWDTRLTDAQQIKYATIHLYEGIELLLKARLMEEHWSLIVKDLTKYQAGTFEKGDFVSIAYDGARERLESVCGVRIEGTTHDAFDGLRKLRNQFVHFSCSESRSFVLGIQLRAWHHMLTLLGKGFLRLGHPQDEMLKTIQDKMQRSEEYLDACYREVKPEIERARAEDRLIACCPWCQKDSLIAGDVPILCPVCKRFKIEPTEAANAYARFHDVSWKHPKHGPDDEVAWCEVCGNQAVVPLGDDLREQVLAKSEGHFQPHEPGEDLEFQICLACGEPSLKEDTEQCGSCGSLYVDSNKDRHCPECLDYLSTSGDA